MGKKGKKTRWRRLPIGGTDEESGLSLEAPTPQSDPHRHRVTFNEDEYTKITTPRQDVLFKKGYFGRKRTTPPNPSPSENQEVHSGDSVENESYMSEEAQYAYPAPAGYMDPTGVYYVNGNTFESYDPFTGTVTVVVGPPAQYPGAPPVLAALPCQPVPLQPVEWFNPAATAPWCYSYNRRKRYSTDSQNCSAQSSESTGPPGSPQEPMDEAAAAMYPPAPGPHYVYPGYMFGQPIYNMNGMTVQGVIPQPVPMPTDLVVNKRRKKRKRRRRGGVTDDGSESSCCEEPMTCDMPECQSETSQSGASSDAGVGPNSDSGINTNSGSNSPPLEHQQHQTLYNGCMTSPCGAQSVVEECVASVPDAEVEASEELSTAEDDVTPNLCAAAPEFSSQESTLSCLSTPSAARDLLSSELDIVNNATSVNSGKEEVFESCNMIGSLQEITAKDECESVRGVSPHQETEDESLSVSLTDHLTEPSEESVKESVRDFGKELLCELEKIPPSLTNSASDERESLEAESVLNLPVESFKISTNCKNEEEFDSTSQQPESELPDLGNDILTQEIQKLEIVDNTDSNHNSAITEERICDKPVIEEENLKKLVVSFIFQPENVRTVSDEKINKLETNQFEECDKLEYIAEEDVNKKVTEQVCVMTTTASLDTLIPTCYESQSSLPISTSMEEVPVPPPRRKKSMNRVVDRVATRVVDNAIKAGLEEAARVRLKNTLSITEAVTRWLNSHESSPLTCPTSDEESDNDEGIEVEEEESTGQKNVRGNPFLASFHSDAGQRVANDCESLSSAGEWDMWDHSHTREMCDPLRSVDRYYRLGADEGVPSVYKTAMHIRHTGPFPCGVCCIIQ